MKNEQEITVTTFVKLDFVDSLKCLFGRAIKITTKSFIPQEQEIHRFNSVSDVEIVKTTTFFTKQSKPEFGYSLKDETR